MAIVPIGSILEGKYTDKQVTIRGWVYRKRESKDINFILMRDATGVIQCTIKKGTAAWKDAEGRLQKNEATETLRSFVAYLVERAF